MSTSKISLNDKYDIEKHQVLLNGTQALVRLMIAQKERDRQAGLNTAGYVTDIVVPPWVRLIFK